MVECKLRISAHVKWMVRMDDTVNCPAFARRLVEARTQRGKTQVETAAEMGMASATLSVLERRGTLATARFMDVLAICQYYGWPLEEVAALCFEGVETAEGLPAETSLLLRGLPAGRKALVFQVVGALARGLED